MVNLKIVLGNKYFKKREELNSIENQAESRISEKDSQEECCDVRYGENKKSNK